MKNNLGTEKHRLDLAIVAELAQLLNQRGMTLATAESCTGGSIGALLTALPGSSSWFNGGIISYTNDAKINLLGVDAVTIYKQGAVSQEVVEMMAMGGRRALAADICVAVSGIAGPDGGSRDKPVGTVWVAWSFREQEVASELFHLVGNRGEVQNRAVHVAVKGIMERFL
ncbi:MAG: CinA family protein [Gammaproteobacteria bacterium]|nr:CinA family protein [Gammaproteobacteria bacterium]